MGSSTAARDRETMLPEERRLRILQALQERGAVTVRELSQRWGVSSLTVRRDLDHLAAQHLLRRTRGGAVALSGPPMDGQSATASTDGTRARDSITDRVDVLVLTPVGAKASRLVCDRAQRVGVPVVTESIPFEGGVTAVAIDDYRAGRELGRWAGAYAREHLGGQVRALLVTASLKNTEARSRGFVQGLTEVLPGAQVVASVNGYGLKESAREIAADALAVHPDVNLIFGINDDSTVAALEAYRAAGLDEERLLVVTFGLEGRVGKNLLTEGGPCKAGVAMFPEVVGRACVDAAVAVYDGVALPDHLVTPSRVVTSETLGRYYRRQGDEWCVDLAAVEALWEPGSGWEVLNALRPRRLPRRLGFVYTFSVHEWYQNVLRAMRQRAAELGIDLLAEDATETIRQELEELKRVVARAAAQLVHDGDSIIVDGGSTLTLMAAELRQRSNLTVITNSVSVLDALADAPGVRVVATGGVYQHRTRCFVGPTAEAAFAGLRADRAFISTSGVSVHFGLSAISHEEAAVKRAMMRAAKEVVLVADHSKVGEELLVQVAPLTAVHRLVTDAGLDARDHLEFNRAGIKVLLAEEEPSAGSGGQR